MFCGLANGNDANVPVLLRMRNRNDLILKKSQRQEATLTVGFPIVLCRKSECAEDLWCIAKIDAVLPQVRKSLSFVPREHEPL